MTMQIVKDDENNPPQQEPLTSAEKIGEQLQRRRAIREAVAPLPPMSDTDIVAGLRSKDAAVRQRALEAVFPHGGGAVLLHAKPDTAEITATTRVDAGRIFNALLFVTQNVGKHLGLALGWVPDAEAMQRAQSQIQVVPEGAIPR